MAEKRRQHKGKSAPSKRQHIATRYVPGEVFDDLADLLDWCDSGFRVFLGNADVPPHTVLDFPVASIRHWLTEGALRMAMKEYA